jgi:glycosyltransferase involved in cell wall biosynthesis
VEWQGVDDAGVRALLQGARALLAPSFAEGYHLPVAEALALGTPVLASDIAAHREIAAPYAELLDPRDDEAWWAAIREYAAASSPRRTERQRRTLDHEPVRWPGHLASAMALLAQAAHEL